MRGIIIQLDSANFLCCFIELPFLSGALLPSPEENCGEDILDENLATGMLCGNHELATVVAREPSIAPVEEDLSTFAQVGDDRDMIDRAMIDESVEASGSRPNRN